MIDGENEAQSPATALSALDEAFARVPAPASIAACPCCRHSGDYAILLRRRRRDLTGSDLGAYTYRALTTVGSATDFRYLAGRILQLSHTHDAAMPDLEVVYGKLGRAGWQSWPEAEAITAVMDALWRDQFTDGRPEVSIGTVLCALGSAQGTVAARLIEWGELAGHAGVQRLHEFVSQHCRRKGDVTVPSNAYWDKGSGDYGELVDWLNGGAALGAVVAAFERADDPNTLELLSEIHAVLDRG
ncbi:hypothetical protein ATM97_32535 [Nocardia sp. MH4]|uniref:hypothetical protein n=1 Tax=unclassified Nocardia TaxID=2637762 RepID=UPI001C4F6F28|nr:hypothetical protein [Nocardia sp. MH4]MBW0274046.1 hypothetical protein [Nocardia sp. MH4]